MQSKFISIHADVMHATPCFAGTRIPVKSLFDYIAADDSLDEFLEQFPTVKQQSAIGVLQARKEALLAA